MFSLRSDFSFYDMIFGDSLLGKWPNTYAFTKALSEDLIRTHGKNLPIGMFRPAIVTSSVREPVVGKLAQIEFSQEFETNQPYFNHFFFREKNEPQRHSIDQFVF